MTTRRRGRLSWAASPDHTISELPAGTPVALERVGGYPHLLIRALFWRQGVARQLPTEHGIDLFRLTYRTTTHDGRIVNASGLVSLPRGAARFRGVVSWQHGTASLRTQAPSSKDVFNGLLPAAVFAGHSYVLLAPDYLGYGVSDEPHGYYLTANMAAVVRDFLDAARRVLTHNDIRDSLPLFLSGFSEGGHATLAAQQLLERLPIDGLVLSASAPIAAAIDLAGLGLTGALRGGSRYCSLYLAWLAKTYADAYGEPLSSVLAPCWAELAAQLFDGTHDGDSTVAALPAQPRELLSPGFLAAHDGGQPHWFLDRLRENSILEWAPTTPMRCYFGSNDADVTPEQAHLLGRLVEAGGGDITTVSVGDVDHEGTIELAAPLLRNWFDEIGSAAVPQTGALAD
jgi:hypothetical protein